ncbi:MAG: hypothetical protein MKZ95_01855 [Pirellulales bacterium]|nr:hypothetical protein [Pirellulales bacterium]
MTKDVSAKNHFNDIEGYVVECYAGYNTGGPGRLLETCHPAKIDSSEFHASKHVWIYVGSGYVRVAQMQKGIGSSAASAGVGEICEHARHVIKMP